VIHWCAKLVRKAGAQKNSGIAHHVNNNPDTMPGFFMPENSYPVMLHHQLLPGKIQHFNITR